jgi:hypothetical protein
MPVCCAAQVSSETADVNRLKYRHITQGTFARLHEYHDSLSELMAQPGAGKGKEGACLVIWS